ncbi:MAG: helix-turn-helix domain-containing protein [Rudaea sp.]|uniref:helix-turn-helix transcriptional regulator n=1 Tax=Rudaea sp. TaxID=2136325 RepID=UPI0039E7221F
MSQPVTASATPILADYLTIAALAAELGVTTRTIRRWRWKRTAPPAIRMHGRILYRRADVIAWIDSQREVAA